MAGIQNHQVQELIDQQKKKPTKPTTKPTTKSPTSKATKTLSPSKKTTSFDLSSFELKEIEDEQQKPLTFEQVTIIEEINLVEIMERSKSKQEIDENEDDEIEVEQQQKPTSKPTKKKNPWKKLI